MYVSYTCVLPTFNALDIVLHIQKAEIIFIPFNFVFVVSHLSHGNETKNDILHDKDTLTTNTSSTIRS